MGKIVVVANHKGGVGKTTLSNTLALGLAHRGYKVVLVDSDAQATLTQDALGIEPQPGFYDLLVRNADFDKIIQLIPREQYAIQDKVAEGWAVLVPGNGETRHIASSISSVDVMLKKFQPLLNVADFIIIDPSPTESLLHPLTYVASDYVLHPTLAEDWSISSLRRTRAYVQAAQSYRIGMGLAQTVTLGIVPTLYRTNTIIHSQVVKELQKELGDLVWTPIHQRVLWSEASAFRQPVISYAPNSDAANEAWQFIDKFLEVVEHG